MSLDIAAAMTTWDEFSWDNVRPGVVYAFSSGRVLRRDQLTEGTVYVLDGVIIPTPEDIETVVAIDLGKNTILAPGFIDLQINGGFGIDFTSSLGEDESGLQEIASKLLQYGVTSFCPTIVSTTPDNYTKILKNIKVSNGSRKGAGCLGAHLEGPFISLPHKGAHDPNCILDYSKGIQEVDRTYGKELKNVAIVTMAPEKENALSVIKYLRGKDIVISIGHTDSSFETACIAIENGASMVTHLFNSMTPVKEIVSSDHSAIQNSKIGTLCFGLQFTGHLMEIQEQPNVIYMCDNNGPNDSGVLRKVKFHHRMPGIVGLLGRMRHAEELLFFGLIADNNHMHKTSLRLAHNAQPSAIVLVSDGIAALGLGDGEHSLGSQTINVTGKKVVIGGTNTLSGSVTPLDQCVRNFLEATGCSRAQALAAATYRPAQVLHLTAYKGNITPGAQADFVVLDDKLNVLSTWVQGRLVHKGQI